MGEFKNPSEMNDDLNGLQEQQAEFLRMCSVLSLRAHLVINHIRLNHLMRSGQIFALISSAGCGLVINMLAV